MSKFLTRDTTAQVDFDSTTQFSSEQQQQILSWAPMQRAIDARQDQFHTSLVLVKGASFIDTPTGPKLLNVHTRVFYKNPDKRDSGYHVTFMPDAASLMVVFRVAAEQVTASINSTRLETAKHYALVIREARWGPNNPAAIQVPAGMLEADEMLNVQSIKRGVAREFFEEVLGQAENADLREMFNDTSKYEVLCPPITLAPSISEKHHPFSLTIDLTKQRFKQIQAALVGNKTGETEEGESMLVDVVSLGQMHEELQASGSAPWVTHIEMAYVAKNNLWHQMATPKL